MNEINFGFSQFRVYVISISIVLVTTKLIIQIYNSRHIFFLFAIVFLIHFFLLLVELQFIQNSDVSNGINQSVFVYFKLTMLHT